MYYDIFHVLRWMRVAVLIGFALHAITSVAALATMIALVVPRPGETPFTHFFTWRSQAAQTYASLAFGSTGFVVDLYLFALPLFAVGKTQMTGRRKLAVMLAFMTGLLYVPGSPLSWLQTYVQTEHARHPSSLYTTESSLRPFPPTKH